MYSGTICIPLISENKLKKNTYFPIIIILAAMFILSGCHLPSPEQLPGEPTPDLNLILTQIAEENQPTAEPTEMPSPTPEPTATPKKAETLTICLGKEPSTLFFYDESSQAMWSVLESIYDGPFDVGDGAAVPVIFDDIAVTEETVTVHRGDIIVDINGDPVEMKPGTRFMPAEPGSGCTGTECLGQWTSITEDAEISRTVITFHLREDLMWNDGTPLTAEDSVFSMSVNGMKGINASKYMYNLTDSYTALDEHTVEWRGLPGYVPDDPSDVFWIPLPRHIMKGMNAEMIRDSEEINTRPLGWGAWQITSWEKGEQIVADRNPYYVPADGTLPFFDRIVYKFYGRPGDNNIRALRSGVCDIIDTSVDLGADLEPILEDVRDGKEAVYIRPEMTRQEIVLNTAPTTYGALKLFVNDDMRQAVAGCIDRKALIRQVLYGQSEIPADFYPQDHGMHSANTEAVPYDPELSKQMLDTMGWTLPEEGGSDIRIATQAGDFSYGMELAFTLTMSDSAAARKAGEMIREDLAQCGIDVTLEPLSLGELYAQGPEGILFGRGFDAAMFAWAAGSRACSVYMSDQIPNETNHWVGTNVGSYQNEDYDTACLLPDLSTGDAREIYADTLPAIPLYFNISVSISGRNICGISDRIGSRSVLWNMEQFSRSEDPCAVSQWNDIYR